MRSNLLKNALSVSFESADPTENEEMNPVTEETTVVVDEVLEEVRDAEENVADHEEAVEELEEASDSLESLITSLESAIEQGGMGPQAAEMYHRGLAIATRRLPINSDQFIVSTESFGGTGDKLVATMEALGKAKDMLSKFWNAIKTAIVNAYNAVLNFIRTLGTSATALSRAAGVLKARSRAMKGKPKAEEISGTAISTALGLGVDSVSTSGDVTAALASLVDGGKGVVQSGNLAAEQLRTLSQYIASGAGSAKNNPIDFAEILKPLPKGDIPGGMQVRTSEDNRPSLVKIDAKREFKEAKVAVADANGVSRVADGIEAVAKMIRDFSGRDFKKLDTDVRKFIKEQDALVKKMDAEKDVKKEIRSELKDFNKMASLARSIGPQYMSHAAKCAKAAYGYGMKSAAQYGG